MPSQWITYQNGLFYVDDWIDDWHWQVRILTPKQFRQGFPVNHFAREHTDPVVRAICSALR